MDAESHRTARGQTLGAGTTTALFLVVRADRPTTLPTLDGEPMTVCPPPWCGEAVRAPGTSFVPGSWFQDLPSGLLLRCTRGGDGVLRVENRRMTPARGPRFQPRPRRPAPRQVK